MDISSAEFTRLTLQEVADFLIDRDKSIVLCIGMVDDKLYSLKVELVCDGE